MEAKIQQALDLFSGNYNCAQATLSVFSDELKVSREKLQQISAAFGAGMCYQGLTCGAVTGAFMALGLYSGTQYKEPELIKENSYLLVREFVKQFKDTHGTSLCRELLGIDISTPEGIEEAKKQGVFEHKCPLFVKTAVSYLNQIILP